MTRLEIILLDLKKDLDNYKEINDCLNKFYKREITETEFIIAYNQYKSNRARFLQGG